jgi:hypothetical protein
MHTQVYYVENWHTPCVSCLFEIYKFCRIKNEKFLLDGYVQFSQNFVNEILPLVAIQMFLPACGTKQPFSFFVLVLPSLAFFRVFFIFKSINLLLSSWLPASLQLCGFVFSFPDASSVCAGQTTASIPFVNSHGTTLPCWPASALCGSWTLWLVFCLSVVRSRFYWHCLLPHKANSPFSNWHSFWCYLFTFLRWGPHCVALNLRAQVILPPQLSTSTTSGFLVLFWSSWFTQAACTF